MKYIYTLLTLVFMIASSVHAGPLNNNVYYNTVKENYNANPPSGIAEFSNVVTQPGFNELIPGTQPSYMMVVNPADLTTYATVVGRVTGNNCTSQAALCDFIVERVTDSSEIDGGKFIMPDFGLIDNIAIYSNLGANDFNQGVLAGCDGVLLDGQSNIRGLQSSGTLDFTNGDGSVPLHDHTATSSGGITTTVDLNAIGLDDPQDRIWQYTGGVEGSPNFPPGIYVIAKEPLEHYEVGVDTGGLGVKLGKLIYDYKKTPGSAIGGERCLVLIPLAQPGTGMCISGAFPNGPHAGPTQLGDPNGPGGYLFNNTESQIKDFLEGEGNRIIAWARLQGEEDMREAFCADRFQTNTENYIADLRRRIPQLINVPVVSGGYAPCLAAGTCQFPYNNAVRGSQIQDVTECQLPLTVPYSGYPSQSNLTSVPANDVHYRLGNYRGDSRDEGQLAESYANRFISLWEGTYNPLSEPEYIAACNPSNSLPSEPTSISSTIKPGGADINWQDPVSGIPSTFECHVRVATDNSMTNVIQGAAQCTPQSDCITDNTYDTGTALTNGTTYFYDVQCWNNSMLSSPNPGGDGWGPRSAVLSFTPLDPPGQISSFTATPGDSQVELNWGAPIPGPTQDAITDYECERSDANDNSYSNIGNTGSGAVFTFTDDAGAALGAPQNGTPYDYRCRGINGSEGNADWLVIEDVIPSSGNTPPTAPQSITVTNGVGQFVVDVTAPASPGIPSYLTGDPDYVLEAQINGAGGYTQIDAINSGTQFTITSVESAACVNPDNTCDMRVKAENGEPNTNYVTTTGETLAIPQLTTFTVVSNILNENKITWTAVTASPTCETGNSYEWQKSVDSGSNWTDLAGNADPATTTVAAGTDYQNTGVTDTNTTSPTTARYRGRCVNGNETAATWFTDNVDYDPDGGGSNPYAITQSLPELLIHAVADVNQTCPGGTCEDGEPINPWSPPTGSPATVGTLVNDTRTGAFLDEPMVYDAASGGARGGNVNSLGERVLLYQNASSQVLTTDFQSSYGKIVNVNVTAANLERSNFLSGSEFNEDVFWFSDAGTVSELCMGASGNTRALCASQNLPINTYWATAFHNGLTGASAKMQMIIYETNGSSDTGGANCTGHTAGTTTNPAVYCNNAMGGLQAYELTGVNQDTTAANKTWLNAFSTGGGLGADAGFSCTTCIYPNVIATGFADESSSDGAGDGLMVRTSGGETLTDGSDLVKEIIKEHEAD